MKKTREYNLTALKPTVWKLPAYLASTTHGPQPHTRSQQHAHTHIPTHSHTRRHTSHAGQSLMLVSSSDDSAGAVGVAEGWRASREGGSAIQVAVVLRGKSWTACVRCARRRALLQASRRSIFTVTVRDVTALESSNCLLRNSQCVIDVTALEGRGGKQLVT